MESQLETKHVAVPDEALFKLNVIKVSALEEILARAPKENVDGRIMDMRRLVQSLKDNKKVFLSIDDYYELVLILLRENRAALSFILRMQLKYEERYIKQIKLLFGNNFDILKQKIDERDVTDLSTFKQFFVVINTHIVHRLTKCVRSPYLHRKESEAELKKRPLLLAPLNIGDELLTDGGGIHLGETEMEAILCLIREKGVKEGQISAQEIQNITKQPVVFRAEYQLDEKGKIKFLGIILPGGCVTRTGKTIENMITPLAGGKNPWEILRTHTKVREYKFHANENPPPTDPDPHLDKDFKIANRVKVAKYLITKQSSTYSHDDDTPLTYERRELNNEMVMEWIPQRTLGDALLCGDLSKPQQFPMVYLIAILINILKAAMALHKTGHFHLDLDERNMMLHWIFVRIIDFESITKKDEQCGRGFGVGQCHKKMKKQGPLDNNDYYSIVMWVLGNVFGRILGFINNETFGWDKCNRVDYQDDHKGSQGHSIVPDPFIRRELFELVKFMTDMDIDVKPHDYQACVDKLVLLQQRAAKKTCSSRRY